MTKYKFETWHLIVIAVIMFLLYRGYGGFVGAIVEPDTAQELATEIAKWKVEFISNEEPVKFNTPNANWVGTVTEMEDLGVHLGYSVYWEDNDISMGIYEFPIVLNPTVTISSCSEYLDEIKATHYKTIKGRDVYLVLNDNYGFCHKSNKIAILFSEMTKKGIDEYFKTFVEPERIWTIGKYLPGEYICVETTGNIELATNPYSYTSLELCNKALEGFECKKDADCVVSYLDNDCSIFAKVEYAYQSGECVDNKCIYPKIKECTETQLLIQKYKYYGIAIILAIIGYFVFNPNKN